MAKKLTYEELEKRVKELEKEGAEHKRAEEELHKSRDYLDSILNAMYEGVVVIDHNFAIKDVNDYFLKQYDTAREDIIGRPCYEVTHKLDKPCSDPTHPCPFKEVFNTHKPVRTEHIHTDASGKELIVKIYAFPLFGEDGNVELVVESTRDITEKVRAEETLRKSEENYRNLADSITDVFFAMDEGLKYTYWNKASERLTGISAKDAIGKQIVEIFPDNEETRSALEVYQEVLKTQQSQSFVSEYHLGGKKYFFEISAYPSPDGLAVFVKDITEKRQAQQALRESEGRYRDLYDNAPVMYHTIDTKGIVLECNQTEADMLGYSKEEIIGKPIYAFETKEYQDLAPHALRDAIEKGHVVGERRFVRKDGTIIDTALEGTAIYDDSGQVVGFRSTVTDITHLKRAKEALRDSEEKYRLLVENANDAIFIAQDEVVKFPNPKTEEMIGFSEEELAKTPFLDLIHPEDRDMVLERHKRRLKGEELPSTYSFRIINRDGEELWAQLNTVLITWEGRPATLNFLRDITQERKFEAQFQAAQRMEAMGTLAGGIAHNFNNILMGIQGNASLVLLRKTSEHPDYERLKGIEEGVKSGAELTRQLLGFARGGKYEVRPTDLNELIENQNRMFGRTKKEITIRSKYQESLWTVEIDQGQIEQVLLNLYVNAWQAMPAGGDLYLQTENTTLDEDYVKPFNMEPGRYVKISVTDTGVGMDKKTRDRIFDPFFTTQEMGRGTGLGLASVYGIVRNHGGIINVDSKKGKGATFTIYLPASEKQVIEEKESVGEILKGSEGILLVDDEDMIIDVGVGILTELGDKVLLARSGKEAIEIYKKNKDNIDMVILDMIMPQMGGGVTYDKLKKINPDIKVLLSSGYSINGQATEILERGCNGFIQKPFNMRALSQEVRKILDS